MLLDILKKRLKEVILKYKPLMIGISAMSSLFGQTKAIASDIKSIDDSIFVVVGGPHPTVLPETVLLEDYIDFVVIGEAEITFLEMYNHLKKGLPLDSVNGIGFKRNGKIFLTKKRPFIRNLDSLSPPAWDLINPLYYQNAHLGLIYKKNPVAHIISSRGCPFNCTFCASNRIWGGTWRPRSVKNVIDEIEFLIDNFNVREFHFMDDNFTLDRKRVELFCNLLINRGIDISWSCPNGIRVDKIDERLLRLMKKSGCYSVSFGVENVNQNILNRVNKRTDINKIKRAIRIANKIGVLAGAFFIFGLPGETEKTLKENYDFITKSSLDFIHITIFSPIPGSKEFCIWKEKNKDKIIDWGDFDILEGRIQSDETEVSLNRIKYYRLKTVLCFYLNPKRVLRIIKFFRVRQIIFFVKRILNIRL